MPRAKVTKTEDPESYKALSAVIWKRHFKGAKLPTSVWKSIGKAVKELMTADVTPEELEIFFNFDGPDCRVGLIAWLPEVFAKCRHKVRVIRTDPQGRYSAVDYAVKMEAEYPDPKLMWKVLSNTIHVQDFYWSDDEYNEWRKSNEHDVQKM